jgi:molybdopterin synthase catalytic subunit
MRVKVLFFGMLKDMVGRAEQCLDLPEGSRVDAVFDYYAERFPRIEELSGSIVMARNQEFSSLSAGLSEGDEIAFLPPVSGGAGQPAEIADPERGHFFVLTREAIDSRAILKRLLRGEDGAAVTFEGVVRNNTKGHSTSYLEYDCYEAMALKKMAEIGRRLATEFAVDGVAMVHRLGRLEVGETSVAIVVTAPHRRPAFEAAEEGINRLKRLVPIWKKEHFTDGEVWVEGEWDETAPLAAAR